MVKCVSFCSLKDRHGRGALLSSCYRAEKVGGCSVPRLERAALVCGGLVGFWFFSKKRLGELMLAQILLVTKLRCAISCCFAQHWYSCCDVMPQGFLP